MKTFYLPKVFNIHQPTDPSNYVKRGIVEGTPMHWRDDVTGTIPAAIMAYFEHKETAEQLHLLILYIQHHIHAPCFLETSPFEPVEELVEEIQELRKLSLTLQTHDDIVMYCHRAMDWALDPF